MNTTISETDVDERVRDYHTAEAGRGRTAKTPDRIPLAGWRDILLRTVKEISEDQAAFAAAGVTFLGLLAIFPAIAVFVSLYGLFADIGTVQDHINALKGVIPGDVLDIVANELKRLSEAKDTGLSIGLVIGLLLTLWSANSGMKALFVVVNLAYDEKEKRGFVQLNLTSLSFTLGAIVLAILIMNALVLLPLVLEFLWLGPVAKWIIAIAPPLFLFVLVNIAIAALYRYGPSRNAAEWSWISVGSILTSVVWLATSLGFSFYLANFGDYNATYGTLGAIIGFMMWMYISAFILVAGAELNAEIEHQTAVDTTVGPDKPMGERGAYVADTLGEKP